MRERERERKHCNLHFHRTSLSGTKHSDKEKLPVGHGSSSRPKKPHSTPTSDSQAEKALVIQAVQQVATTQQLTHKISKAAQDKMDDAAVRWKAVTIVDNLVQNKDFKVHDIVCVCEHMHACAHL